MTRVTTEPLVVGEGVEVRDGGRTVRVVGSTGEWDLSALWLRDQCSFPECLHASGQRLFEVSNLPLEMRVSSAARDGDAITLRFELDEHLGRLDLAALAQYPSVDPRTRTQWDAASAPVTRHEFESVLCDLRSRLDFLSTCDEFGFALLRGVPLEEGTVTTVAELFGHVRVTNYGRLFDVRTVVDPSNLANTSLALGGHTDNPYRTPVPTLQLLHCLASSVAGGVNTLVDGYRVADELRGRDPESFEILATTPILFRYADDEAELETWAPVIERDTSGTVTTVRFNTRSARPSPVPADHMAQWYRAYRSFAVLLREPRVAAHVALQPGDLMMFDNRRILHGRTGYDPTAGARHLQGCYADVDSLRSTIAVLEQRLRN